MYAAALPAERTRSLGLPVMTDASIAGRSAGAALCSAVVADVVSRFGVG